MQVSIGQHHGAFRVAGGAIHTHRSPRWTRCRRAPGLRAVAVDDLTAEAKELGVSFSPLHEDLGVDVTGIDLSGGISDAEGALVKKALDRYLLLRFRQQTLEPADEAGLLTHLPHDEGRLEDPGYRRFFPTGIPGFPYIQVMASKMELTNYYGIDRLPRSRPNRLFAKRLVWHPDTNNNPRPVGYSYMYMKQTPGQRAPTSFVSTVKAYELLSDEQKKRVHKMRSLCYAGPNLMKLCALPNSDVMMSEDGVRYADPTAVEAAARETLEADKPLFSDVAHPFAIEEKGSGVRSLFVAPFKLHSFTGMTTEESHEFLEEVLGSVIRERKWCAEWEDGDVVVWKNRQVLHAAPPCDAFQDPRMFHLVFWETPDTMEPVKED